MKTDEHYESESCCLCKRPTNGIYYRFPPEDCVNQHDGFTHALCDDCFGRKEPYKTPVRLKKQIEGSQKNASGTPKSSDFEGEEK